MSTSTPYMTFIRCPSGAVQIIGTAVFLLGLLCQTSANAGYEEGESAYLAKDYPTAAKELLPVAQQGNPKSQRIVGEMYASGYGVVPDDGEALKWLRLSADKEDSEAQILLGNMILNGKGVPKNPGEAIRLYRLAAAQNNVRAFDALRSVYFRGNGVPQDLTQAAMWFRRAKPMNLFATDAAASPSSNVPRVIVGSSTAHGCRQVNPEMPRKAIQSETTGTVRARVFLVDGVAKDVTIVSGPDVFHSSVRRALLQMDCLPNALTAVAQQDFVFDIQ